MTLSQLRRKHPSLIYQDFKLKPDGKNLRVSFNFLLEPDIVFTPEIIIPLAGNKCQTFAANKRQTSEIRLLIFHLGLVEAISYWKAACPPELVVEAGYLSSEQISWWKHLFIHGLGEFFFRNNIDFSVPNFLSIVKQPSSRVSVANRETQRSDQDISIANARSLDFARDDESMSGDLILVGGGKDSIVTMETLKQIPDTKNVLMLNPGPNSLAAVRLAGYQNPLIITRKIDPKLLQLNKQGYLNGHTPFSAYLAFLGVLVANLYGYKNVISSNELGAGEASLIYKTMEINHQYSKSFTFEKKFREYVSKYLSPDINYFSFLRPLYELQIASIFSRLTNYNRVSVSCNVGRGKFWCGRCPKCAFNYLSLFPFMSDSRLKNIFKSELFENPQIQKYILDLVGLGQYKPLDCIGTKEESILAVVLAIKKLHSEDKPVSGFLLSLEQKLNLSDKELVKKLENKIIGNWSDQHFLPTKYSKLLKEMIS